MAVLGRRDATYSWHIANASHRLVGYCGDARGWTGRPAMLIAQRAGRNPVPS